MTRARRLRPAGRCGHPGCSMRAGPPTSVGRQPVIDAGTPRPGDFGRWVAESRGARAARVAQLRLDDTAPGGTVGNGPPGSPGWPRQTGLHRTRRAASHE